MSRKPCGSLDTRFHTIGTVEEEVVMKRLEGTAAEPEAIVEARMYDRSIGDEIAKYPTVEPLVLITIVFVNASC